MRDIILGAVAIIAVVTFCKSATHIGKNARRLNDHEARIEKLEMGGDTNGPRVVESDRKGRDATTPRPDATPRRGYTSHHDYIVAELPDELASHEHHPKACVMEFHSGLRIQWLHDGEQWRRVADSQED